MNSSSLPDFSRLVRVCKRKESTSSSAPGRTRYWEIDFLRGIAVMLMIGFHFWFDLHFFGLTSLRPPRLLACGIASLFLLLVGISYTLSYSREHEWGYYVRRGLKIFSWGLLITLITWLAFPEKVIVFGVLHLIGVSVVIVYPLAGSKHLNFFLGAFIIFLGILFYESIQALISFSSFDFFPLFPWLGVVLIGLWLGKLFYPQGKRRAGLESLGRIDNKALKGLSFLGRNSLLIYLAHQPLLVLVLMVFSFF